MTPRPAANQILPAGGRPKFPRRGRRIELFNGGNGTGSDFAVDIDANTGVLSAEYQPSAGGGFLINVQGRLTGTGFWFTDLSFTDVDVGITAGGIISGTFNLGLTPLLVRVIVSGMGAGDVFITHLLA